MTTSNPMDGPNHAQGAWDVQQLAAFEVVDLIVVEHAQKWGK